MGYVHSVASVLSLKKYFFQHWVLCNSDICFSYKGFKITRYYSQSAYLHHNEYMQIIYKRFIFYSYLNSGCRTLSLSLNVVPYYLGPTPAGRIPVDCVMEVCEVSSGVFPSCLSVCLSACPPGHVWTFFSVCLSVCLSPAGLAALGPRGPERRRRRNGRTWGCN